MCGVNQRRKLYIKYTSVCGIHVAMATAACPQPDFVSPVFLYCKQQMPKAMLLKIKVVTDPY